MRTAHARGVFTALDPNIRPGLIPDPDAYRARFLSWLPSVSLLKLSEEDARWLGGTPTRWLAAGPAAVVVTRGGDGLTVFTREGGEYSVPGERVEVVDTIGAGDTVNAALLHGLEARGALSERGRPRWARTAGGSCSASRRARRRSPAHARAPSLRTRVK